MAEQPNFDALPTKEIAALYKKTLAEAQKQRGFEVAKNQAQNDFGLDADYFLDGFGNAIPGPKPPTKRDRHYISSEGYVVELAEGEQPPISQGATVLEKVTAYINSNPEDPDIKELLPEDLSVFEEESTDFPEYILVGTMGRGKWRVTAVNQQDASGTFKFVLANDLDRDAAIAAAHNYLETRIGPKFRELSQTDLNLIQRISVNDRNEAMLLYLRARLPVAWAEELESLIVQSEITGTTSKIMEYVSRPEINDALEEAIYNSWFWNRPHLDPAAELQEFLQQRTANIVLTFPVLDSLLKQFQTGRAVNYLGAADPANAAPSQQDLENLSDAEVADLWQRSRLELARSNR